MLSQEAGYKELVKQTSESASAHMVLRLRTVWIREMAVVLAVAGSDFFFIDTGRCLVCTPPGIPRALDPEQQAEYAGKASRVSREVRDPFGR